MYRFLIVLIILVGATNIFAQYRSEDHRELTGDEIAVTGPGSYYEAGATYVLTNDVTSEKSSIFLGKMDQYNIGVVNHRKVYFMPKLLYQKTGCAGKGIFEIAYRDEKILI